MQRPYAVWYIPGTLKEPQELLPKYEEYQDIFSKDKVNELLVRGCPEHAIELTGDPSHGPIYNLSEKELKVLRKYI